MSHPAETPEGYFNPALEKDPERYEEFRNGYEQLLARLESQGYDPICVFLFGSLVNAKKKLHSESDVDLFVVVEDGSIPLLEQIKIAMRKLFEGMAAIEPEPFDIVRYIKQPATKEYPAEGRHLPAFSEHLPYFDVHIMTYTMFTKAFSDLITETDHYEFGATDWMTLIEERQGLNSPLMLLTTIIQSLPMSTDRYPVPPEIGDLIQAAKLAFKHLDDRYRFKLRELGAPPGME